MTHGKRIAELRKEKGMTQSELAKTLGITRSGVSNYETGNREPEYELLRKMSDFFDCSVDYLLGKTNKRKWDIETIAFNTTSLEGLSEEDIIAVKSIIESLRAKNRK